MSTASTSSAAPVTYTEEQYNEAIAKARTEATAPLTADLEKVRAENVTLKADALKLTTELSTLKTTTETLQKSLKKDGTSVDLEKLIDEVSERVAKQASSTSSTKIAELETQVATMRTQLAAKDAKDLRDKIIAEAGGLDALIPELVKGNTEEELRASVKQSKEVFDRTTAKAKLSTTAVPPALGTDGKPIVAPVNTGTPVGGNNGNPVDVTQVPPNTPAPVITDPANNPTGIRPVGRADPAQWRQQRGDAMKRLEGRYAAAGT